MRSYVLKMSSENIEKSISASILGVHSNLRCQFV